jgi:hypothetical protein
MLLPYDHMRNSEKAAGGVCCDIYCHRHSEYDYTSVKGEAVIFPVCFRDSNCVIVHKLDIDVLSFS